MNITINNILTSSLIAAKKPNQLSEEVIQLMSYFAKVMPQSQVPAMIEKSIEISENGWTPARIDQLLKTLQSESKKYPHCAGASLTYKPGYSQVITGISFSAKGKFTIFEINLGAKYDQKKLSNTVKHEIRHMKDIEYIGWERTGKKASPEDIFDPIEFYSSSLEHLLENAPKIGRSKQEVLSLIGIMRKNYPDEKTFAIAMNEKLAEARVWATDPIKTPDKVAECIEHKNTQGGISPDILEHGLDMALWIVVAEKYGLHGTAEAILDTSERPDCVWNKKGYFDALSKLLWIQYEVAEKTLTPIYNKK